MIDIDILFYLAILIMSVVVHEVSHGYAALLLGDRTALLAGRLTLNPIRHLDPVGSFLVPVVTYLSTKMMFGWAKPVPYNPYNLSDRKWGEAKVALAGPAANFALALVFALLLRLFAPYWQELGVSNVFYMIVVINVFLGFFNLVPVPPLDGSKLLFSLLPYQHRHIQEWLERYSLILILVFVFFLWDFVAPFVLSVAHLLVGG
jgi:Zn-dependent protease